jgi:colicin import membrane protein
MGSAPREPGWAASWALAIAVHAVFFAFLYFGVSWRPKLQSPLSAELWSELPPVRQAPSKPRVEPRSEPPPPPPQAAVPPPKPEPAPPPAPAAKAAPPAPSKTDIELKERARQLQEHKLQEKKAAEEERRRQALARKEEEKRQREEQKRLKEEARAQEEQRRREEKARLEQERREAEERRREDERRAEQARREQEARLEREAEARRTAILDEQQKLAAAARERAAVEAKQRREAEETAARARELETWKTRIHDRIKSKLVLPPNVPDSARAEYSMTIIPGGEVLAVKLRRTSGFPAYDAAIERAINAAAPLPVPGDPELFQQMRELNLVFRAN